MERNSTMTGFKYQNFTLGLAAFTLTMFAADPTALASEPFEQTGVEAKSFAPLTVNITSIDNDEGDILIAVFNSEDNYSSDKTIAEKTVAAKAGTVSAQFHSLSPGSYAIKVLHDEDRDKKIDLSFIGAPSEDYGFSQNARDPFSQPEWEEAKFELTPTGYTATIQVK